MNGEELRSLERLRVATVALRGIGRDHPDYRRLMDEFTKADAEFVGLIGKGSAVA